MDDTLTHRRLGAALAFAKEHAAPRRRSLVATAMKLRVPQLVPTAPERAARLAGFKRREALRCATPAWSDAAAIERLYKIASDFGLHVDHVIPLRGRNVSGLHVLANLQLLTPRENAAKGNRFDVVE